MKNEASPADTPMRTSQERRNSDHRLMYAIGAALILAAGAGFIWLLFKHTIIALIVLGAIVGLLAWIMNSMKRIYDGSTESPEPLNKGASHEKVP